MEKLKQAHGNWVAGEDRFWNREKETDLFIEYLDEGASIHMIAQRRIGKTSLMQEVARRIEDRYICLPLDLQTAHTAEDLIAKLSATTLPYQSLWQKTKAVFSNTLGSVTDNVESLQIEQVVTLKIREGLMQGNWQEKGNRLLDALAASETPVVVFMDEVPVLVNRILKGPDYQMTPDRIEAADALMSWLRDNSIRHRGAVRFVVTGSIGFEPILRQAGLSATINNLKPFHLEPWSPDVAMGCLRALANQYDVDYDPGACERMVERLGSCIPHHVQMFFGHIYETCRKRGDMTCTIDDVDHVYEKRMLSTKGHAELSTFEERLEMMVGKDVLPYVLDLLTEAAVEGQLTPEAIGLFRKDHDLDNAEGERRTREVLDIREHDGYLKPRPEGYIFVSHLLRDWWKRRFGSFGFVVASERDV